MDRKVVRGDQLEVGKWYAARDADYYNDQIQATRYVVYYHVSGKLCVVTGRQSNKHTVLWNEIYPTIVYYEIEDGSW